MGIGAALIMPGTLSTITSVFPPEERAKAVGIWAGFAGTGGTLGLLASGALLEGFYWGSIFLVTAGLALAALLGVIFVVPSTKSSEHVGLDPTGSVLSALGIGLLVLGIIEGPERGWTSPLALGGLVGGVVLVIDVRSLRVAEQGSAARSSPVPAIRASPPGRRRCSSSSSPCSASSSCRCSSCNSCSATARSRRRSRSCRCR